MHQGLECIFDWMEFTIHDLDEEEVVLQVLEMNLADFLELPKGRYGYKKQLANGHISVLFCGTEEWVHVISVWKRLLGIRGGAALCLSCWTGSCCTMENALGLIWPWMIKPAVSFPLKKEAIKTGTISSRWKSSTEYVRRKLQDGEITAHTINIGSRKSKMYMRIYDKALSRDNYALDPHRIGD